MSKDFVRINEIKKLLHNYNYEYYVNSNSLVSDYEFDLLLRELQFLEKKYPEIDDPNSPTKRVGSDITSKFITYSHDEKMYSLDNTYSFEEISDWVKRIKKIINNEEIEYSCELKYDGASINITYEKGELIRAVTRGDGLMGDDVTRNIKTIKNIPLKLKGDFPSKFDIRGEIIIPLDGFKKMNKEKEDNGEQIFMNPRNTASGSIKLQDSKEVSKRPLIAFMYGISMKENNFDNHYDFLEKARKWGFKVPEFAIKSYSIDDVFDFLDYWKLKRNDLNFEIDGVVIKTNSFSHQKQLGFTSKSPRWAIAYKFKAEQAETLFKSISYQVGRTGAITPVANLEPVLLSGSIVKRASLHNADQIEKLKLRIGDKVYVEKGGEIIPKITGVIKKNRPEILKQINFIENCPECNSKLTRLEGEAQHYCLNSMNCDPQIIGRIQHFIGRNAMNIEGLGVETITLIYKHGLINNIGDLYSLKYNELIYLERMAEKSVNNLLKGIEKSKEQPFHKVLFGMGIRHVGYTVAKRLVSKFRSMNELSTATFEDLISVDDIGDRIAESVINFFKNEENLKLINQLKINGLNMYESESTLTSKKLKGMKLVVTGTFKSMSRNEIKIKIQENGGIISSSISSKTSFLVAGSSIGPAKKEKAENLKINIIDENEFLKMLEM